MLKRFVWGALLLGISASLAHAELVSYWPLDEFPNEDSTPDVVRGYDMQLVTDGFVDATNHVDGKFGKAFQFYNQNDGAGDQYLFAYEQQSEDDLLPINLQPEFSISMWAKVKGTGQNDWRLFSESNTIGVITIHCLTLVPPTTARMIRWISTFVTISCLRER